ncbi:c-type cytochrome [Winogradskyella sp. SM1960]|uniref:c-type cytochrome n=1 Tax=Winogradskyella sp. SM1960 TaxID=2865955 RepID=UPI001CD75CCD|nr:cytochrome c [Winogradskyella sp. SM1960]
MKNIIIIILSLFTCVSCKSDKNKPNLTAQNEYAAIQDQDKPKLEASIKRGESVYSDMCITCHLPNGKGVPKAFPPLADSDFLRENQIESIKAAKYGMSGEVVVNGITYNSTMAPLGLSDEEVADVMNYINNSWGNSINNFVTPQKVSEL